MIETSFQQLGVFKHCLEDGLDRLEMAACDILESFSSLKSVFKLLEECLGVLYLENQDSPESLEQAFPQNELEAKLIYSLSEHCDHEPLGFFKMSIKRLAKVGRL